MPVVSEKVVEKPIDLDAFKEPEKPVEEDPALKKSNFMNLVTAEVADDEKDSNFGDYGEESEEENDSDD